MSDNFNMFVKRHSELMNCTGGEEYKSICKDLKRIFDLLSGDEQDKAAEIMCGDNPETD